MKLIFFKVAQSFLKQGQMILFVPLGEASREVLGGKDEQGATLCSLIVFALCELGIFKDLQCALSTHEPPGENEHVLEG